MTFISSWVNRYEKQHWHDTHNHVNSLISGTYYVKADGLEPIKFFSPSATSEFGTGYSIDDVTIEEYRDIEFSGSAGVQTEMRVFPRDGEFLLCFHICIIVYPSVLNKTTMTMKESLYHLIWHTETS